MTNTITVNLTATSGSVALPSGSFTGTRSATKTNMASSTQAVGVAYEILAVPGDVTWPADVLIYNTSATATLYVSVTSSDTYRFATIPPLTANAWSGMPALPYVKFDVADQAAWRAAEV